MSDPGDLRAKEVNYFSNFGSPLFTQDLLSFTLQAVVSPGRKESEKPLQPANAQEPLPGQRVEQSLVGGRG